MMRVWPRFLFSLLMPVLGLAGCASDKSFALISVLAAEGEFTDVAQLHVTVKNGGAEDLLMYPTRPTAALRLDSMNPITFSVSYSTNVMGTLEVGVAPVNANGVPLGYGTAATTIDVGAISRMTILVDRNSRPPERMDAGASDGAPQMPDGPAACEPTAPATCGSGRTCAVRCRQDNTAEAICSTAGRKQPGEVCESNQDCSPGSQCFQFACPRGEKRKTCLRFCTTDQDCGAGARCATNVPCASQMTRFKACSQPCDPRSPATTGCATGLSCFIFPGEVTDCECAEETRVGGEGATCETDGGCLPGLICVSDRGVRGCRSICRLDAPATCPAGRSCKQLFDPDYKTYGACLPP